MQPGFHASVRWPAHNRDLDATFEWGCTQEFFYRVESTVRLPVIERAQGIHMWDVEGQRYIDASSGPICSNIGHCHPRVAEAMYRQALKLDFSYARVSRTAENLAVTERIARLAGPGYERVFMASGGSEAVDMAFKFARQYRYAKGEIARTKIISLMPSYHGMTLATVAASGDFSFEPLFGEMAVFSEKIPAPLTYRLPEGKDARTYELDCAQALENKILELGSEHVLAFIVEPVGGLATGCLAPSEAYFNEVRRICDRHGVILVFDEIMSGGGRTGAFLTAHLWPDARPDLVVLGKGIGAGYTPLGVMLAPAAWVDELRTLSGFNYAHTANANPISCTVANTVLDVIEDEGLIDNAARMGDHLRAHLADIQSRTAIVGDIRGRGLLMAMEICDKHSKEMLPNEIEAPNRLRQIALDQGMILYARRNNQGRFGDWLMITPPLVITREQCDDYAERLERTIVAFEAELRANGVIH